MTLNVIYRLQAFSNAIRQTFVQHFTRFQLTTCSHGSSASAELLVILGAYLLTYIFIYEVGYVGEVQSWSHGRSHGNTPTAEESYIGHAFAKPLPLRGAATFQKLGMSILPLFPFLPHFPFVGFIP